MQCHKLPKMDTGNSSQAHNQTHKAKAQQQKKLSGGAVNHP